MNHQQTHVTANLGALELGALALTNDGALEAAGGGSNPFSLPPMCPRIDDGAFEAAVAGPQGPFTSPAMCHHIEDGSLEATGLSAGAPTKQAWTGACCGRIDAHDDAALEASRVSPHTTLPPRCHFIDDGLMEDAGALRLGPSTARRLGPNGPCV
jgi:hypothetical protein